VSNDVYCCLNYIRLLRCKSLSPSRACLCVLPVRRIVHTAARDRQCTESHVTGWISDVYSEGRTQVNDRTCKH